MSVSFNVIPSGLRVPLFYAEIDNSAAFTPVNSSRALLIGQMTSDGQAQEEKPVLCTSAAMANKLFGRGSVLARMVAAYRTVDVLGEIVCIPVEDASSGTQATGTVALTGTAAEAGTIFLYICGKLVRVGVAQSDEAADVATTMAALINADKDLPVTATASSGTVTLTAKNKGTLGNDILVQKNLQGLAGGESDVTGLGVEITAMSSGATDPDFTNAIKAMGDEQYDFIAVPYSDAATLNAFSTAMNDTSGRWGPYSQIYGHVYSMKRGDINALTTFGATRNNQHETVTGIEPTFASWLPDALGAYVARTAVFISADPARPTQTGVLTGITGAPAGERFMLTERQSLLTSGIATITTDAAGTVTIERAITTYQTNAYGDGDASYLDSETLHTSAYVMRRLRSTITSKYGRHKLANDGTRFGPGQAIVTPNIIRSELIAIYRALEREGIVENAELFQTYLIVERDANDPNRINVLFPPDYVNQLRIFALLNQFRLQYPEE